MEEDRKCEKKHILSELGLRHQADAKYLITVRIAEIGQAVPVRMEGWQSFDDAIKYLKDHGFLNREGSYSFVDWPYSAGGAPHHTMACVCELKDREFTLIKDETSINEKELREMFKNMVCLYGCPNARKMEPAVLRPSISVISYD